MCSAGEGVGSTGPLPMLQTARTFADMAGKCLSPIQPRYARWELFWSRFYPCLPTSTTQLSAHTSQTSANIQSYERIFAANGPPPPPKEDAAAAGKQAGAKSARERSKAKGPTHSHYLQSKVYRALERIKAERAGEEPVDAAAVEGEAAAAVAEAAEAVAKQQGAAEAKEGEKKQ